MKGVIISISIFFVMLIGIFFSINYLNKVCTKLDNLNKEIEISIENKSWTKAYDNSIKFLNQWDNYSRKISIFVNHAEIDNINSELWKLTQYTKCKAEEEALASSHVIKFLLEHIVNLEKVNAENIF
ncbi:DUF4363 family protein [Clostridium sp. A1-XYC3]|uniref:DUF4363 family protein n=1 Tax=Clostridium tanneri TaxID=3037988 RepID=A0ABU4JRF8_9CLOT|nr:DUF4363 family protein [Clostridium sp. A1-XYC3]MDW8800712.1 DUF4363 family protein [Clostridium sp. A1-XYC3]